MPKYDSERLVRDIEKKKDKVPSLSDTQLKKEVSHLNKLLQSSLPDCLRQRAERIVAARNPEKIETEIERFNFEARWFQLLLDYERRVAKEAEKRKIA
ncbi:MAG: hypothetical protein HY801_11025 [Candidatus Lindowbacteria bacterium]|nr:hypothetical protein [Candidatus Lindowbacteria bacterium]